MVLKVRDPLCDGQPQAHPAQRRVSCSAQQWTPEEFRTGRAPPALSSKHNPSLQRLLASHLPMTDALPGGKSCKTPWCRATRRVQLPSACRRRIKERRLYLKRRD
ncbi:uncharacterized protein VSU04_008388 [Chlamydotis macqueenii]